MLVLTSAYCRITKKKLPAMDMYHLPGDGPGGIDTFCTCHDEKILYDEPLSTAEVI